MNDGKRHRINNYTLCILRIRLYGASIVHVPVNVTVTMETVTYCTRTSTFILVLILTRDLELLANQNPEFILTLHLIF